MVIKKARIAQTKQKQTKTYTHKNTTWFGNGTYGELFVGFLGSSRVSFVKCDWSLPIIVLPFFFCIIVHYN
jgi:hypothetical protein